MTSVGRWSEGIRGHERAKRMLAAALERDRIAHAYLFSGPEGVGKRGLAVRFAAAVIGGAESGGSGAVASRVLAGVHPDVIVYRLPAEAETLGVDQVRELEQEIARSPFEAPRRVVVVDESHRMTESAANAFLKTLEEPPARCVLVLLADRLSRLPDTILSRCQSVPFGPLPEDVVRAHLTGEEGVDPADALWLAAYAEGSIGRAVRLAGAGLAAVRGEVLERLDRGGRGFGLPGASVLASWAREGGRSASEIRRRARIVLDLIAILLRDLLVLAEPAPAVRLYNPDQQAKLAALASRYEAASLEDLLERTFRARESIDRNANVDLVLDHLGLSFEQGLGAASTAPSPS